MTRRTVSKSFAWESATAGSLLLKVTKGDKTSTWKIRKATSDEDLYQIFTEIAYMIDPGEHTNRLQPVSADVSADKDSIDRWNDFNPSVSATSEQESMAALAAKARSVDLTQTQGKWFGDDAEDLPFHLPNQKKPE